MESDTAIAEEQRYVDRAYGLLNRGLADAEIAFDRHGGGLDRLTARAMKRAREILQQSRGSGQLVVGRMDTEDDSLYIGRRRVYDHNRDLVVVGWHAPAAIPFYEATPESPGDLTLKRVFQEENGKVLGIVDEIVRRSATSIASGEVSNVSDALLKELERARDGAMREVIATIQAEQFRIIRADLEKVVVVQGGPGTGKTVVGLHRAAWLAFNHPELQREGILVVAPSSAFLAYVSGVLPSLDVADVDQVEIGSLYPAEVRGTEPEETSRVKGSAAMAQVLRRALDGRIGRVEGDLTLMVGAERIVVPARTLATMIERLKERDIPHNEARDVLRSQLAVRAFEIHEHDQHEARRPMRTTAAMLRRLTSFANALDRLWPSYSAEEFVRTLYGTQSWLIDATDGILTADERASLYRPPTDSIAAEPWTPSDLHVLDEVSYLLEGDVAQYGHVVVDEAQDLSPMAARALARRCPGGSMTVLGDLAQATDVWLRDTWDELTRHLTAAEAEVSDLTVGYRVPAEVIELASRQLELISPGLIAPRSVRRVGEEPAVCRVDDLAEDALSYAETLAGSNGKTALVVPDSMYDEVLALGGEPVGDGRDGDFSRPLTILPVSVCKGLEFDTVVLCEPGTIVAESTRGHRLLYVAMTRCTQRLHIVHQRPLPRGLDHLDDRPGLERRPVGDAAAAAGLAGIERATHVAELIAELSDDDLLLVEHLVRRLANGAVNADLDEAEEIR